MEIIWYHDSSTFMQDCAVCIANALEIQQSSTKWLTYHVAAGGCLKFDKDMDSFTMEAVKLMRPK